MALGEENLAINRDNSDMRFQPIRHRISFRALSGLVLVVGGCGGGNGAPVIYPVSGKILVDGKPAAKAQVTFHALSASTTATIPFAETNPDGSFHPSTQLSGDGAPAGDYTVTVVWHETRVDRGEEISGKDRLGGRYGNPQNSNLKVTIKPGENSLPPLELKSSR